MKIIREHINNTGTWPTCL